MRLPRTIRSPRPRRPDIANDAAARRAGDDHNHDARPHDERDPSCHPFSSRGFRRERRRQRHGPGRAADDRADACRPAGCRRARAAAGPQPAANPARAHADGSR